MQTVRTETQPIHVTVVGGHRRRHIALRTPVVLVQVQEGTRGFADVPEDDPVVMATAGEEVFVPRGPGKGHDRKTVRGEAVGGGTSLDVTEGDLTLLTTNWGGWVKKNCNNNHDFSNLDRHSCCSCLKYDQTL